MKNYQKAIEELIRLCGFSQNQMSRNSGFGSDQISKWKNGLSSPSLENYIKLCESNGVNPDVPLSKVATNEALSKCEKECLKCKKE